MPRYFASESAARSSKLLAFCCCATAMAVRNGCSAGAVFAGSRLTKICPRMRCSSASHQRCPVRSVSATVSPARETLPGRRDLSFRERHRQVRRGHWGRKIYAHRHLPACTGRARHDDWLQSRRGELHHQIKLDAVRRCFSPPGAGYSVTAAAAPAAWRCWRRRPNPRFHQQGTHRQQRGAHALIQPGPQPQ